MNYANELLGWPMYLNQGKFRQNGGCGYILKPEIMRNPNEKGNVCLITSSSLATCFIMSLMLSCDAAYTPSMTRSHDAVTPVNLEITVSIAVCFKLIT